MPRPSTVPATDLLDELEDTLVNGTVARRVEILRSITDLFLVGGDDYSDDQLSLFDDVFACLVQKIELSAKALLAKRLSQHPAAPPRIIHRLAFDDIIAVAGPVLTRSPRLDDATLIENARTKSQDHLLAISKREHMSEAVTDVLVERGNMEVVSSTASNPGASFSESGYSQLIERAERNDDLAIRVGSRINIPRHHLLRLIAKASASVRAKLQAIHPDTHVEVAGAVRQVAVRAQHVSAADDPEIAAAQAYVNELYEAGQIDEKRIAQFALAQKFNEMNAAVACLAKVPFFIVESMMIEARSEGVMVLSKVLDFSWDTVKIILDMRATLHGSSPTDLAFSKVSYERLKISTAQQILRFHKMQQGQPAAAEL
jgi:uncharacterized protein (DUF2336 family)